MLVLHDFLHPKNKVKDIIQNQTATQQLNGLIVQSREVKSIRREDKECIIFRHEDFGGQLLWALERGAVVDIEGPAETFFNQPPPADAAALPAAAGATDQVQQQQQQQQQQGGGGNDEGEEGAKELPRVIQEILARGGNYLDADDYMVAVAAAPMVDDDNEPAPENVPVATEQSNDIFSGWEHSGICHRRCMIQQNPKCVLKFWTARDGMLDFRKRLSFKLIENAYMKEDNRAERQRSSRIRERIGHGLVSLPPWKNFLADILSLLCRNTLKKCTRCCREVRTYCVCSPGVPLCSHCLASHIKDSENDS